MVTEAVRDITESGKINPEVFSIIEIMHHSYQDYNYHYHHNIILYY